MSRKQGIPAFGQDNASMYTALQAVKNNIEVLTGVRGGPIDQLSATATPAEIIRKINEIVARLNASGK